MRGILRSLGVETDPSLTMLDLIHALEKEIGDLRKQKENNRLNRDQMQKDVTKLLKNQAMFDDKVKEMDNVFKLLQDEKHQLKKKRRSLKNKAQKIKNEMVILFQDLQLRRQEVEYYKKDIRTLLDREIKTIIQKRQNVFDLPCQYATPKFNSIKPLDNEQLDKENQLCDWEVKVHEMELQATQKLKEAETVHQISEQKRQEIRNNTTKLEKLTERYDDIIQKEQQMQEQAEEMDQTLQEMDERQKCLKEEEDRIQTLRAQMEEEWLRAGICKTKVEKAYNQIQMSAEDKISSLVRQEEKCKDKEKDLIWREIQLKADKQAWQEGVEIQTKKLNDLMAEKQEHVALLEVTIRQQMEELSNAQKAVDKKEQEFQQYENKARRELEEKLEGIERKTEIYGEIMEEWERKEKKKERLLKCGSMPRQMASSYTATLSHQTTPAPMPSKNNHFRKTSPIKQTQTDISFDQDRQLEMLLSVKEHDNDKSLLEDSDQENKSFNKGKPPISREASAMKRSRKDGGIISRSQFKKRQKPEYEFMDFQMNFDI